VDEVKTSNPRTPYALVPFNRNGFNDSGFEQVLTEFVEHNTNLLGKPQPFQTCPPRGAGAGSEMEPALTSSVRNRKPAMPFSPGDDRRVRGSRLALNFNLADSPFSGAAVRHPQNLDDTPEGFALLVEGCVRADPEIWLVYPTGSKEANRHPRLALNDTKRPGAKAVVALFNGSPLGPVAKTLAWELLGSEIGPVYTPELHSLYVSLHEKTAAASAVPIGQRYLHGYLCSGSTSSALQAFCACEYLDAPLALGLIFARLSQSEAVVQRLLARPHIMSACSGDVCRDAQRLEAGRRTSSGRPTVAQSFPGSVVFHDSLRLARRLVLALDYHASAVGDAGLAVVFSRHLLRNKYADAPVCGLVHCNGMDDYCSRSKQGIMRRLFAHRDGLVSQCQRKLGDDMPRHFQSMLMQTGQLTPPERQANPVPYEPTTTLYSLICPCLSFLEGGLDEDEASARWARLVAANVAYFQICHEAHGQKIPPPGTADGNWHVGALQFLRKDGKMQVREEKYRSCCLMQQVLGEEKNAREEFIALMGVTAPIAYQSHRFLEHGITATGNFPASAIPW
jgi:hypothetical protein